MRVQAMSSSLRVTMSPTEARAIAKLIAAGDDALGAFSPDCAADIMVMLQIGASEVRSKQENARRARAARNAKPSQPPLRNITIDGYTICARLGDWIDVSPDPDSKCWVAATPERRGQHEIRRGVWHVVVLNPDPYGSLHLGPSACTETASEADIERLARRLVEHVKLSEAA